MRLDLCHKSEYERSYFQHTKVHLHARELSFVKTMFVSQRGKNFERTETNFAFKISFWMCADLFCVCNVSLACSPDCKSLQPRRLVSPCSRGTLMSHVIVRRLQRRSKSDKCPNQNPLLLSSGSRSLWRRMKSNNPMDPFHKTVM